MQCSLIDSSYEQATPGHFKRPGIPGTSACGSLARDLRSSVGPPSSRKSTTGRAHGRCSEETRSDPRGSAPRISHCGHRADAGRNRAGIQYDSKKLILVDSNIPMYLVGSLHIHKSDSQRLLEKLVSERQRLVTDAEVLQEILHRYTSIQCRDAIQPAFNAILDVVDAVFPIDLATAERAKEITLGYPRLSARDAVHLAVMQNRGIEQILSFDSGFDAFPGVSRLF
jgi:predicted nucleic acid-binding protein